MRDCVIHTEKADESFKFPILGEEKQEKSAEEAGIRRQIGDQTSVIPKCSSAAELKTCISTFAGVDISTEMASRYLVFNTS